MTSLSPIAIFEHTKTASSMGRLVALIVYNLLCQTAWPRDGAQVSNNYCGTTSSNVCLCVNLHQSYRARLASIILCSLPAFIALVC